MPRHMRAKQLVIFVLIVLLILTSIAFLFPPFIANSNDKPQERYIGVSFNGNTTAEAKLLIDRVKTYTNLFIFQSAPLRNNKTAVIEVCDYAASQGLNVIINIGVYHSDGPYKWTWQMPFLTEEAPERYGRKFLGVYYDDEPVGIQLDYQNWYGFFERWSSELLKNSTDSPLHELYVKLLLAHLNGTEPENYDAEAEWISFAMEINDGLNALKNAKVRTFTTDYVLYWFDYLLGGYDVMFAQIGTNCSYVQDIALIRGAANMQNKEWGVIMTWKYDETPYLDTGEELYHQMLTAYESGAKYMIIFNYPSIDGNPYGVMQDDHFQALERLWNDVMKMSQLRSLPDFSKAEAALVLPRNYGWGMRHQNDTIWGVWGPDDKSEQIWAISRKLLSVYGVRLDIVYDDPAFPVAGKYNHIYYWNQTNV